MKMTREDALKEFIRLYGEAETTVAFYKDDTEFYEAYKGSFDGTYQRLDITKRERE